jgi:hypothetical protein
MPAFEPQRDCKTTHTIKEEWLAQGKQDKNAWLIFMILHAGNLPNKKTGVECF